jgi:hypothetical protein
MWAAHVSDEKNRGYQPPHISCNVALTQIQTNSHTLTFVVESSDF